MTPKKNSDEKKVKDKKTIPKATKKKPSLKTPPAKQTIDDSKKTRISTLRQRGRTVLPKEAKELVNKAGVEVSTDTKKSQSKIRKTQPKNTQSSPKKDRREKSKKINVELANEVARYQLAKPLPIIEITIPSFNAPVMGKEQQNEPCDFTGTGMITIGRKKLTVQVPSLEKTPKTPKTSVIAPKRSRKKKKRSSCHCTQSDATYSPSESSQSTDTTVSKKVRKKKIIDSCNSDPQVVPVKKKRVAKKITASDGKNDATYSPSESSQSTNTTVSKKVRKKKVIDSCNSDPQVVPVKKKRVAKKITASDGKNANTKKVNVKNDTQKVNLPKIGSDLEINILDDAANNIGSPSILPAHLSLGVGNSNSSHIKDQNKTVKKPVQRRKLNLPKIGSDSEINILEDAANNIGSPSILPANLSLVVGNSNSSPIKNQNKTVKKPVQRRKLNLPKVGSNLEINILEDAANNIGSPSILPANLSLGAGNSISSPIKNQNKTVKKHVQRRKLNLPNVGSVLEINILEDAANNIGSPSILPANLSLGAGNSISSPIKNQNKTVKKHVQRRKLNLPKVGSDLEINILEDAANNIGSPSILPANLSLGAGNSIISPIKNQNETVKKSKKRRKLNSSKKYPNGVIKNYVTSIGAKEPEFLDGLDTLSWTKQISSSDTSCTSVCSTKSVRTDVQLLKLGQACQGFVKVDKISEISSIISSPTYSRDNTAKFTVNAKKTVSSSCSSNSRADLQDQGSYGDDLKKLNSTLSRFINSYDMEVMDWLGTDNGENKSIRDNIFYNCFKVESQAFNILKNIENIWAGKDKNVHGNNDVHSPVGNGDIQADDNEISALNHDDVNNHNNTGDDDEDALSLFAESLVSSRRTSITSKTPEFEEYVAQPIANVSNFQKVTYVPTKIVKNINEQIKTNNVCEKHNADSTSVREMDRYETTPMLRGKVESLDNIMSPPMKISHYIPANKPSQRKFSMVYKGVCFYNLISKCKRFNCTYPHENLEVVDVKNNMSCLPNDMFAQEYTLTKSYPPLRQKFIVAFIEECIKRKSTKLLLEMCTDYLRGFKATSEPNSRKTYVLEITMLHLNEVPLSDYTQLLKNEIYQQTTLCEVFMGAIASAQNFQQFKQLFVNLVDYMLNVNRAIELEVAMLIVERLCILPSEDALINAFFKVIMNTHMEIINCPFIGRLEKRLQSESVKLYEHFLCIKNAITISLKNQSGARTSVSSEEKHSRTSPDTTNLDYSVKTTPISTHKIIEQREGVVAEDNLKSYTISQTPQRGYNSWSPQNSFQEDRFDRPQHEFAVPQYYRSRNRRPGPRSHGAPRGFKGGRPHYRRHLQPPASYVRRPYPNGRVGQKTSNNHWKNRKGEHYNRNSHYYS